MTDVTARLLIHDLAARALREIDALSVRLAVAGRRLPGDTDVERLAHDIGTLRQAVIDLLADDLLAPPTDLVLH